MSKKKKIQETTFGICTLSVIPVRQSPNDSAEMVSQLLYGELVEILNKRGKSWIYIKCQHDNYEGWIDKKQIQYLSDKEYSHYTKTNHFALEVCQPILSDAQTTQVLMGSSLPAFDGMSFTMLRDKYVYSGQVYTASGVVDKIELIDKIARRYLGTPYLWGGRSPFGIDCSGFVQVVFKILGISLSRDASQQIDNGVSVDFVSQAQLGDLAFFENKDGKITHVGIILDNGKIIHASGQVRIDDIDHYGIYDGDRRSYSHKLRLIRRVV